MAGDGEPGRLEGLPPPDAAFLFPFRRRSPPGLPGWTASHAAVRGAFGPQPAAKPLEARERDVASGRRETRSGSGAFSGDRLFHGAFQVAERTGRAAPRPAPESEAGECFVPDRLDPGRLKEPARKLPASGRGRPEPAARRTPPRGRRAFREPPRPPKAFEQGVDLGELRTPERRKLTVDPALHPVPGIGTVRGEREEDEGERHGGQLYN